MTQQEEWNWMEPPNGARQKWNRPGRPLPVIEEARGQKPQGVWTVGNEGGRDESSGSKVATASPGSTGCGGSNTPRRDADRHGGLSGSRDTVVS